MFVFVIPSFADAAAVRQVVAGAASQLGAARRVIFDLRGESREDAQLASTVFRTSGLDDSLPAADIAEPPMRRRLTTYFQPQRGSVRARDRGSRFGPQYFTDPFPRTFLAPAAPVARRIVFVINAASAVPRIAWALRQAGQARIVFQGDSTEASGPAEAYQVRLTDSVRAEVRVAEVVDEGGGPPIDAIVPRPAAVTLNGDPVLSEARRLLRDWSPLLRQPLPVISRHEPGYPEMRYPTQPYRILAAYRYWNAIHYFFPYKELIGEDWHAAFPRFIRSLDAARDSLEYALSVASMAASIHSSHGSVASELNPTLIAFLGGGVDGGAFSSMAVQLIEGRPIVVRVNADSSVQGVSVGDEIIAVDGEEARALLRRRSPYIAASTPQSRDFVLARDLLAGPRGSTARVRLRSAAGSERDVTLARNGNPPVIWRDGPVFRLLPDRIGYADLNRLRQRDVDSMFKLFRDTRAIILDGRGAEAGAARAIASRLMTAPEVAVWRSRQPLRMSPDSTAETNGIGLEVWQEHTVYFRRSGDDRYAGQTLLLIDERAYSNAESIGQILEAAGRTTFIGSPTQGANGDRVTVTLPGDLDAGFEVQAVMFADGRQLQRVGLQPRILVRPTVSGVRAGRDEVLERAIQFVLRGR